MFTTEHRNVAPLHLIPGDILVWFPEEKMIRLNREGNVLLEAGAIEMGISSYQEFASLCNFICMLSIYEMNACVDHEGSNDERKRIVFE